jgi:hypothetical protein
MKGPKRPVYRGTSTYSSTSLHFTTRLTPRKTFRVITEISQFHTNTNIDMETGSTDVKQRSTTASRSVTRQHNIFKSETDMEEI